MHAAAEAGRSEDDASEGGCRFTMSVVRLEPWQSSASPMVSFILLFGYFWRCMLFFRLWLRTFTIIGASTTGAAVEWPVERAGCACSRSYQIYPKKRAATGT